MSEADLAGYLRQLMDDPVFRLQEMITIQSKSGAPVPLKCFPSQQTYLKYKSRINDIVKVRQQGVTTLKLGDAMALCRLALYFPELRNRQYTIFTKADEDNLPLFLRVRFMDAHLVPAFAGKKRHDSSTILHYEDTGCTIRIMTAGKSAATAESKGRSSTDFEAHITEPAYIPQLDKLLGGLVGSIAPGGSITMESTSGGPRGYFIQHFLQAVRKGREVAPQVWQYEDQTSYFFGLLEHTEYRLAVPADFQDRDDEEAALLKRGVPAEVLMFRRAKIREWGEEITLGALTPQQRFKREYPIFLEDALEEAGGAYFNPKVMVLLRDYVKATWAPPVRAGLVKGAGARPETTAPGGPNRFTIWKMPAAGWRGRYILFGDCGQGTPTSDFDQAYVGDLETREIVAGYRGRLGPRLHAANMMLLGAFYYNAMIGWDITGIGAELRPILLDAKYPNLWTRRAVPDFRAEPEYLGLVWNQANKAEACSMLRHFLEQRYWIMPDPDFFEEANTFGFQDPEDVNPQAAPGFPDDAIMTMAGLLYMAARVPAPMQEVPATPFQDVRQLSLQRELAKARASRPDPRTASFQRL